MTRTIVALSLFFFTLTAFAQPDTTLLAQAFRTVNVRSGPGTQYDIIGRLSGGVEVTVSGRSDLDSNWLYIDFNGNDGWVAFFTVSLNGDPAILPIVESQTVLPATPLDSSQPSSLEASTEVYATAFRRVNVRSGPDTSYDRLGSLNPGDRADIAGRTADGQWLLIDYSGEPGWVAYFVVSVTGDLELLSVIETDSLTALGVEPLVTAITIVTRFNTNLRLQPTFDSEVLLIIPFNTTLDVQARTANNTWLRVTYGDQTGWLMTNLVNIDSGVDLDSLPVE